MRYFSLHYDGEDRPVLDRNGALYDLSTADPNVESFGDLVSAAAIANESLLEIVEACANGAPTIDIDPQDAATRPLDPDEIWGAGVTYAISQESREGTGAIGQAYLDAYEADRPELYFKATPDRAVGPGDAVGIRGDSKWDVPEPELALVLHRGEIVGYTIGNDMCSRDIERENLLYLPQSKIYDRCCSIGPCIVPAEAIGDPHDLEMTMTIEREGSTVFRDSTNTGEMVRTCGELATFYRRHNTVPELSVLVTGTSIIPPDDLSLTPGDHVTIDIESIGTLWNPVTRV
jgi:2-dehydro-3-deoxy-D-arabinonate dehydratase